jgi:hypothetical protein
MPQTIRLLLLAIAIAALGGCANCTRGVKHVVSSTDKGHGFCSATLMRPSNSDFESIGYFGHCFFRGRDLGSCDALSVSPSGQLAAWQDSSTGRLRAFSPAWSEPRWLTDEFKGVVSEIEVSEASNEVHVRFDGVLAPLTLRVDQR